MNDREFAELELKATFALDSVNVGDIVEVTQLPGQRWAVLGRFGSRYPARGLWRLQREAEMLGQPPQGRVAGDGDISSRTQWSRKIDLAAAGEGGGSLSDAVEKRSASIGRMRPLTMRNHARHQRNGTTGLRSKDWFNSAMWGC